MKKGLDEKLGVYMFGGLKKKLKEVVSKFAAKEKAEEKYALEEPKEEAKIEEKEARPEVKESRIDYVDLPKEKFEAEETEEYKKIEEEIEKIHEKEKQIEEEMKVEEILEGEKSKETERPEEIIEKAEEKLEPELKVEEAREEKKDGILSGLFRRKPKPEPKIGKAKEEKKEIPVEKDARIKEEPEKQGFLQRVFKKVEEKTLSEEEVSGFLKDLNTALLENDVAFEVAERICDDVKKMLVGKSVKRGKIEEIVTSALRDSMLNAMKQEKIDLEKLIEKKYNETKQPFLIIFFGFNGVGKTTCIAKFAHKLKKYRPVIAAGDTFRAASIEQIEEHGRRIGVKVIKHNYGADSAAVVFDAVKHAASAGSKVVLADTAGRSHSNVNLMDELKKVVRVNKPDLKILVLDSITGNDIYDQSQLFNDAAGVDAIILTKADVYEKGGAALSASHTIKKPILYLGTGQNYDDLKDFVPEEIVKNLLE